MLNKWKQFITDFENNPKNTLETKSQIVAVHGGKEVLEYDKLSEFGLGMWHQLQDRSLHLYLSSEKDERVIHSVFEDANEYGAIHRHSNIELGYVVEGVAYQSFFGKEHAFKAGDFWLVDKNCFHSDVYHSNGMFAIFIDIPESTFDESFLGNINQSQIQQFILEVLLEEKKDKQFLHFACEGDVNTAEDFIDQISNEIINRNSGYKARVANLISSLFDYITYNYTYSLSRQKRKQLNDLVFIGVDEYMKKHYKDVTIQHLEEVFHYNTDYYNRLIKSYTDMTYSIYLQQIRLKEAERLLTTSTLAIETIVCDVGYSSKSYFYQVFNRVHGMTPNAYRSSKEAKQC